MQLKLKSRKANKASITSACIIWSHLSKLNSGPWISMKFIYVCAELHIRGYIVLYSSNWNQWKQNQLEKTQERALWDIKGWCFSEVQHLGDKETGVTKTLLCFSIQCEELFWKWSHDSCDGHFRCRVLLPIRHVFRCPSVELLINWPSTLSVMSAATSTPQ